MSQFFLIIVVRSLSISLSLYLAIFCNFSCFFPSPIECFRGRQVYFRKVDVASGEDTSEKIETARACVCVCVRECVPRRRETKTHNMRT